MATPFNTILTWFETGDFPTQAQFAASWSSFWHKDETIPMAKIENLSQMFQLTASAEALNAHINDASAHTNYLAKKDASNADREAWRTKLGVGDLPPNLATLQDVANARAALKNELLDGAPAAYDTLKEISNYIASDQTAEAAMLQQIGNKVDKPTADGSYVLTKAGAAFTWSNASNFGKNIANSAQSTTVDGGVTQNFDYTWNANGNYLILANAAPSHSSYGALWLSTLGVSLTKKYAAYQSRVHLEGSQMFMDVNGTGWKISSAGIFANGLTDKSPDSTYIQMIVRNTEGQLAYSSGKEVMKMLPSLLSTAEKEAYALAWNNQYSNSSLNVYAIAPPIQKSEHVVKYFVLYGLNLNTNPQYTSVKLIPSANALGTGEIDVLGFSTSTDGKTMIISLYGDAVAANTNYNVVIRTTSPIIQTHRTTTSIKMISATTIVNLNALTWNKVTYNGAASSVNFGSGNSFSMGTDSNIKALAVETVVIAGLSSSKIFSAGQNWYINFETTYNHNIWAGGMNEGIMFGLMDNGSAISLSPSASPVYKIRYQNFQGMKAIFLNGIGLFSVNDANWSPNTNIIAIKNGTVLTLITVINYTGAITDVKTFSIPDTDYKFAAWFYNSDANLTASGILKEAFTY